MKNIILSYFLYLVNLIHGGYGQCDFPGAQRGAWVSSERGFLLIQETSVYSWRARGHRLPRVDFECIEKIQSQYLLRGNQELEIFGGMFDVFLCLNITQQDTEVLHIEIDTEYNTYTQDFMYLAPTSWSSVNMSDVCKEQSREGSRISLFKNVSHAVWVERTTCPRSLNRRFTGVTANSAVCLSGNVSSCDVTSRLIMQIPSACTGTRILPVDFHVDCMFSHFVDNVTYLYTWSEEVPFHTSPYGYMCMVVDFHVDCMFSHFVDNVTYLYTWSEEVPFHTSPYGYMCMKLQDQGGNTTIEVHGEYCHDNLSLTLTLHGPGDPCVQPSTTTKLPTRSGNRRESAVIYVIVVVIVLIIVIVVALVIFCNRSYICDFLKKRKSRPAESRNGTQEDNFTDLNEVSLRMKDLTVQNEGEDKKD